MSSSTRRALACGVILLALAAVFLFTYDDALWLCEQKTGKEAGATCKPPGVELLVLFFLPGLALLVPDLSELSIFGIGVKAKDVGKLRDENVEAIEGLQRALRLERDQRRRVAERVRDLERRRRYP